MPTPPSLSPPDNSLPLATLSPKGTPPKARLFNATQASDIFWNLHDSNQPRAQRAAIIQGMFDGNPPYNEQKRRNAGMANRPNFNTLEAAARKDAAKVPFYDLFSTAPGYAYCETDEEGPLVDAATASRIRSEAFDTMLESYSSFDNEIWTMLDDFVAFNKGFLWFPRPDSWHFKRLRWDRVLFPQGTSTDSDEWELFAIEHRFPPHRLWSFIADEAASTKAGWNRMQVIDAIRRAAPDDIARDWSDPMEVQRQFRDNDFWLSARIGVIRCASIYTREFNGKWSRMLIEVQDRRNAIESSTRPAQSPAERASQGDTPTPPAGKDRNWLYQRTAIAENLYQLLIPFIFETGDGSINELSGLGKRIVSYSQTIDRLTNEVAMNAFMRSNLVLQAQTGGAQVKQAIVQLGGGIATIPPGYAIQQGSIFGDIEGGLAVSADMRNRLDANTGIYRPQFEKPSGNPESATAANIRFSQATILTNSAVNRFYRQLDPLYNEIFRRATQDLPSTSTDKGIQAAIDFQRECIEMGLTKEQCRSREPGSIRAVRSIGNGSSIMRQQALAALGQLVPYMGPRGLLAWKTDFAAAYTGQKGAMRYFPLADTAQVPTRDDWDATQENADFATGNQAILADWQDHETHAKVHLTAALAAIQSVLQGGADPGIPFTFLQLALPHTGEHISKVGRESIRKELESAYKKVAQGAQQVAQVAQKQVQQQGQQQDMTLDQQLKVIATQHDIQLRDMKTQAQMKQREEKQRFDMGLAAQKAQQEAALADAHTAHEITTSTATTAVDIQTQKAKADAQIEATKAKATSKDSN